MQKLRLVEMSVELQIGFQLLLLVSKKRHRLLVYYANIFLYLAIKLQWQFLYMFVMLSL